MALSDSYFQESYNWLYVLEIGSSKVYSSEV